jgi:hypothetical protein
MNDIERYLADQKQWSTKTFGSGKRTKGILQHIRKELAEIESKPDDLMEWIDVMILAMDGFWRHGGSPNHLIHYLNAKQRTNFMRDWPKPVSEDEAVEHIREAV